MTGKIARAAAFTGTRKGMTAAQRSALSDLVALESPDTVHNGCAEGADEEMVEMCYGNGLAFHFWPCNSDRRDVMWPKYMGQWHPITAPLARNVRMVNAADFLIACPDGPEKLRSGTWSTVRYARSQGKRVVIVWPDGRIEG